jgi:hypothetical protein
VQTNPLSDEVDAGRIRQYLRLLSASLPARKATTDFFYGDPREALAAAAAAAKAAEDYCASGPGDDTLCGRPSRVEEALRMLGSYGLRGNVTADNAMVEPLALYLSLARSLAIPPSPLSLPPPPLTPPSMLLGS